LPADAGAEMSGRLPVKAEVVQEAKAEPIAAAETSDRRLS
jgi:hypothetical protein